MKKILSLGAAAAVLSLTAVAASAAITPKFTTDTAVAGETVTVEIVAEGMTQAGTQFNVVASENLELVEAVKGSVDGAFVEFSNNKFAFAATAPAADGTLLLTLTYTVNAAADEDKEVSVKLVPDEGFVDIDAAPAVLGVVDGNPDITVEPTVEETYEETTEEGGLTTVEDTAETEPTDEGGEDNGETDNKGNPITGVGLAVVPAVLAGAAIVVAKKRK